MVVTYETCLQISDFKYLGKVYNVLSMQVIEDSIDEKYGIRESYVT